MKVQKYNYLMELLMIESVPIYTSVKIYHINIKSISIQIVIW